MTTSIEWARNADGSKGETWNPTTGCDQVSPGCDHCYAKTLAGRLKAMGQAKYQRDGNPRTSGPGFGLTLHPDALDIPLRRKKPTTWFVDSMSDLFHPEVPNDFIVQVWLRMALARRHTFQVLTKRPQRAAQLLHDPKFSVELYYALDDYVCEGLPFEQAALAELTDWAARDFLANVWMGTSIESDGYVWRADHLRRTPAAVRFLSLEPLLGPVPSLDLTDIDWVIVGGESGPKARPMHPYWVRQIRDRCVDAGVALFVKQWGAWAPVDEPYRETDTILRSNGYAYPLTQPHEAPGDEESEVVMRRVGKKAAGRELDGRTWDEMPAGAGAAVDG